jgi:hypothetical protein
MEVHRVGILAGLVVVQREFDDVAFFDMHHRSGNHAFVGPRAVHRALVIDRQFHFLGRHVDLDRLGLYRGRTQHRQCDRDAHADFFHVAPWLLVLFGAGLADEAQIGD